MNLMHYKGYTAKVEYSEEDKEFVGRVLGIRDVIGFHGKSVSALETDFHGAMDFYLKTCEQRGKTPDKPYSGKVNLRLSPEKHRALAQQAVIKGKSINDLIVDAIDTVVSTAAPATTLPATGRSRTRKRTQHK